MISRTQKVTWVADRRAAAPVGEVGLPPAGEPVGAGRGEEERGGGGGGEKVRGGGGGEGEGGTGGRIAWLMTIASLETRISFTRSLTMRWRSETSNVFAVARSRARKLVIVSASRRYPVSVAAPVRALSRLETRVRSP